jgi:hypothetical protein
MGHMLTVEICVLVPISSLVPRNYLSCSRDVHSLRHWGVNWVMMGWSSNLSCGGAESMSYISCCLLCGEVACGRNEPKLSNCFVLQTGTNPRVLGLLELIIIQRVHANLLL